MALNWWYDLATTTLKREVIDNKLDFALRHRYLHFPINLNEHWTIVVFDTEDGTWRHYNSLAPRANFRDPQLKVAESLVPVTFLIMCHDTFISLRVYIIKMYHDTYTYKFQPNSYVSSPLFFRNMCYISLREFMSTYII